jgi:sigma-B regulation protein RsbU (phosphoserine phosphatase)
MQQTKAIRRKCSLRQVVRVETRQEQAEPRDVLWGAKEVYEALCAPPRQRIGGFDIACSTVPARHVSGDFVITFEQDGAWYLALGDLMGKGVSAAMWLTHVLDLLRRSCEMVGTLPDVMASLNREMHRSRVCVPLTSLFLARLDLVEKNLTYSCGGCPPAFLLSGGQDLTVLDKGGPILGALEKSTYSSGTIEFGIHDTLLVASDGIIEVHHGNSFELRPDRVAHHLQFTATDSAASIVQSLLTRVKAASPFISDDLSLLAVKRMA